MSGWLLLLSVPVMFVLIVAAAIIFVAEWSPRVKVFASVLLFIVAVAYVSVPHYLGGPGPDAPGAVLVIVKYLLFVLVLSMIVVGVPLVFVTDWSTWVKAVVCIALVVVSLTGRVLLGYYEMDLPDASPPDLGDPEDKDEPPPSRRR